MNIGQMLEYHTLLQNGYKIDWKFGDTLERLDRQVKLSEVRLDLRRKENGTEQNIIDLWTR